MSERSKKIHAILTTAFQPIEIHIEDESWKHANHAGAKESGGGHFVITIIAEAFAGKSAIEKHRMIYQALKNELVSDIHALSINAKAP
jgi:BolA protein